jgi:hypothetical protein
LDTTNVKPQHKFFERFLDIDLKEFTDFAINFREDLVSGKIIKLPQPVIDKYESMSKFNTEITTLDVYYNIFRIDNPMVAKLKDSLRETVIEACDYYGIDFEGSDYVIQGWLNFDYGTAYGRFPAPTHEGHEQNYHEHMGGFGIPDFHGYYCIKAEPSITHYKINGTDYFQNINIDNRLVVSETGHPHGAGDWESDEPRITLAYDIFPKSRRREMDDRQIKL